MDNEEIGTGQGTNGADGGTEPNGAFPETEPEGGDLEKWKAHSRAWEARAKANKAKADRLDALEEASKSELQKATERAEKAEVELKRLKAEARRERDARDVSEETGFPAELLQGSTKAEMKAFAERHAHFFGADAVPAVGRGGTTPDETGASAGDPLRALFESRR